MSKARGAGGAGPKAAALRDMVTREGLGDRVHLVGPVQREAVRTFLNQGHVFLNASLTESFCMAILEAASAGLLVVSTSVGGVPEVVLDGDERSAGRCACAVSTRQQRGYMAEEESAVVFSKHR